MTSILDYPSYTINTSMGQIVLLPRDGKRIGVFSLNTWRSDDKDAPFRINGVQYRLRVDATLHDTQGVLFEYFNLDKQHSNKGLQDYSRSALNKATEMLSDVIPQWAAQNPQAMATAARLCKQEKQENLEADISKKEQEIEELRSQVRALSYT